MNLARSLYLSLVVSLFIVVAASCNKEKYQLREPDVTSVQIISLKLQSNKLPALQETFFSIDHRKGEIYNAIPLPYQSEIGKVKLEVKTPSSNQVQVFVNGSLREAEKDSVDLTDWQKGIELVVKDKENRAEKKYRLSLSIYDYDPLLFIWEKVGDGLLPAMQGVKDITLDEGREKVFLSYLYDDKAVVYQAIKEHPENWQKLYTFAKPHLQRASVIGEKYILALSAQGELFFVNPASGIEKSYSLSFSGDYVPKLLMGGLQLAGEETITACLVAENKTLGKSRFALATIAPETGDLVSAKEGYDLSTFFPINNFESKVIRLANQPHLFAVGGRPELNSSQPSGAKEPFGSVRLFSTTTGLDWLALEPGEKSEPIPHQKSRPALIYDRELKRFYLYISDGSNGYMVYHSQDGANWSRGEQSIMLHLEGETIGGQEAMLGYALSQHRLVLLGGKSSSGDWLNSIWRGQPKIYATD